MTFNNPPCALRSLSPLALIARLAAIVPPPRRHLTGYFGVLSSHSSHRSQCVPLPVPETTSQQADKAERVLPLSHYISWSELLRKTFEIDTTCLWSWKTTRKT